VVPSALGFHLSEELIEAAAVAKTALSDDVAPVNVRFFSGGWRIGTDACRLVDNYRRDSQFRRANCDRNEGRSHFPSATPFPGAFDSAVY
jgi:hypothetical protein